MLRFLLRFLRRRKSWKSEIQDALYALAWAFLWAWATDQGYVIFSPVSVAFTFLAFRHAAKAVRLWEAEYADSRKDVQK